jgi:hypothetical protein
MVTLRRLFSRFGRPEAAPTICARCRWHQPYRGRVPLMNSWKWDCCRAPAVNPTVVNLVTGETPVAYPYCTAINPDGRCRHYEPKETP